MTKRKVVIQVTMPDARSRSRAMVLAAKANGVSSIAIAGALQDQLEVVGDGMDITRLVKCLDKKLCHAEILKVEEVKPQEKKKEDEKKKPEPKPCECPPTPCSYYHTPLHMAAVVCDNEDPRGLCHIL
ncbi:unnamed protein product [Urochloa decumbens]|uniref:ATFP4 n=1 Tax=Urochloa decumbens TaxID=240449 RepID=A0ABC9F3U0_9POAL